MAVGAVLSPALHERDSYPLSTYPMFSAPRARVETMAIAVGYEASGRRLRLSPSLIAGGIEVIHAAVTVQTSIRAGDTAALCAEIAARARSRSEIVRIEVVSETVDVVAYFSGEREPLAVQVHASCAVNP